MSGVDSYEQWRNKAEARADRVGAEAWRADPQSSVYDAELLREHTEELTRTREAGKALDLVPLLREALYRHLGELADPRLYAVTPLGTKHVVEAFYEEALACIEYLADPDQTGLEPAFTLAGWPGFDARRTSLGGRRSCFRAAQRSDFFTLASSRRCSRRGFCPMFFPGHPWALSSPAVPACEPTPSSRRSSQTHGSFAPMRSSAFRRGVPRGNAPYTIRLA